MGRRKGLIASFILMGELRLQLNVVLIFLDPVSINSYVEDTC